MFCAHRTSLKAARCISGDQQPRAVAVMTSGHDFTASVNTLYPFICAQESSEREIRARRAFESAIYGRRAFNIRYHVRIKSLQI